MTGRTRPRTGFMRSDGCGLYYEEAGDGVPILLIHPAGATVATWGPATAELARIGRVHAAPFDATANFVQLIADTVTSRSGSGAA